MPEQAPLRRDVQPIYRALIKALSRRVRALGWTLERLDERSGVPDRYASKALSPDSPSGRQARYETLQLLVDALYPSGFLLTLKANPTKDSVQAQRLGKKSLAYRGPSSRKTDVTELGRLGGLASHAARMAKHTPEQRKRMAQKAARARARALTPQERAEIARDAANSRWERARERTSASDAVISAPVA